MGLGMTEYSPRSDDDRGTFVFLFGAGCSADGGSPVMRDFMGKAREYGREPDNIFKNDHARLRQFRQECLRICYVFDRWWENIEDLYTQAHLQALAGLPDADDLCGSITRVIWDVYHRKHNGEGYRNLLSSIVRAMNRWMQSNGPRPVIITTNYDVQLEAVLTNPAAASPMRIFYPGPIPIENGGGLNSNADCDQIENSELLEVVKLHGSANWFEEKGRSSGQPSVFCRAARDTTHAPDGGFAFQNDSHLRRDIAGGQILPLIVPPTLGKTAPSSPIAQNWHRAIYNLRNARLLVIAGYSFPETDSFMTRLLAEGIKGNDNLEQMIIINNSTDPRWHNHVKRIFTRSWMKYNVSWVQGTFIKAMAAIDNPIGDRNKYNSFPEESRRGLELLSRAIWVPGPR